MRTFPVLGREPLPPLLLRLPLTVLLLLPLVFLWGGQPRRALTWP